MLPVQPMNSNKYLYFELVGLRENRYDLSIVIAK